MRLHRFITATAAETAGLKAQLTQPMSRQETVRIEGLLLSLKGYTIDQISDILEVKRDTVARWETEKLEGLKNRPKSGRKRIYTVVEEKK
ncbi:helix-turn-helix domain-containing protein [Rapidithrix thailandica]|uniref:helix-turn-helix domain-containing protein n=1 Tax=Rapidithrix thailandica TaxID=413964 RepID=UPI003D2CAB9A